MLINLATSQKIIFRLAYHFTAFINRNLNGVRQTHYFLLDSHISRRNKKALELFRAHNIELPFQLIALMLCDHLML